MNLISAEHLFLRYGEKIILDDVSFGIAQGQKIALVGVNGCGKSTLLKILADEFSPERGQVATRNNLLMTYLPQKPLIDPSLTVLEATMDADDPMMNIVREYETALYRSSSHPGEADRLYDLVSQMDVHNAWNFEAKVKEILGKLGLHDLDKIVGELSGGQQKRVGLAKALLREPDLLLLDEPTNHLDLDVIEWLEDYLDTSTMSILMVTHDRYFLESVTNEILELDKGKLFQYSGNYSYFLEKKSERMENEKAGIAKARNLMKKELDWIRRQPKARGTKAKYRVEAFDDLQEKARKKVSENGIALDVQEKRLGGNILELKNITKSFDGTTIIKPFSYTFRKGEKIGVVGKNGTGKSTFLNILTGLLAPDGGIVQPGVNTHFGFFRQEEPSFPTGERVLDIVRKEAEVMKLSDGSEVTASQMLQRFNFDPKQQYDLVDKLSGGEKRRLQLLLVLLVNPNFLILDEPTNDLDLITLQVLEDFLLGYNGCLLIVSHDRYFMNRLVDHLFVFEANEAIQDFNGTYEQYRIKQAAIPEKAKVESPAPPVSQKSKEQPVNKLSYKEKREMEKLESDVNKLNGQRKELLDALNSGRLSHEELLSHSQEIERLQSEIDDKELRWLELSEKEG